jgi:arylformamidase
MSGWIDISVPLRNGMPVWPGDRPFEISRDSDISLGHTANLSSYSTSAHVGTHMDAPLHFVDGGASIDRIPIDVLIGPARVVEIADPQLVRARDLEMHDLRPNERILFKTRNSSRDWASEKFTPDFVSIAPDAARHIAARRVALVGIDYLSVGAYAGEDGAEAHRALLGAGVWILEGLNLHGIDAGDYELVCLPLKIAGADGAPARAVLRHR